MQIERYHDGQKPEWDGFIDGSKNATFLFRRDYMDYHRDRFEDHSLLARDDDGTLVAVLPANRDGAQLVSHGGLTYGGFATDERMTAARMLTVLERTREMLRRDGFDTFVVKAVPYIYHTQPSDEFSYAAFRCGAQLYRRDVTTTVVPAQGVRWQERRLRSLKKARGAGVICAESVAFDAYWTIVAENLRTVYDLKPVHSVEEIVRLHAAFPDAIRLFTASLGGEIVAGIVMYDTGRVAHAQYTASSATGRACGALDLLFHYLITEVYATRPYFDFGVSTEDHGGHLNEGLVAFKEGFGGRTITHDFYRVPLT